MISRSLSISEKRAHLQDTAGRLAEFCQALYPLLVVHSDDHGRHVGDAFTVKHQIDPTSRRSYDEFAKALLHLHEVGLIIWYEHDGRKYYQIREFDAHQSGLHKRTPSRLPEPPKASGTFREIPSELKRTETEQKGTEGTSVLDPNPSDVWASILKNLDISASNRREWFEPCRLFDVKPGRVIVNAPSPHIASWIQKHFSDALASAIERVLPGHRVEFIVRPLSTRASA
jgi:hypothetical protein